MRDVDLRKDCMDETRIHSNQTDPVVNHTVSASTENDLVTDETWALCVRDVLIVMAYATALLLVHLGPTRVLNHHEVIFAQAAREMWETGDWIVPRLSGVPCTYKPPGTNWFIALSMYLTGSQAEWAVRLPTALAGIGTAAMVAILAARWLGRSAGIVAGLVQASTYYEVLLSHTAEADMLLTMFVTAAMSCFAVANVPSPRGTVQSRWMPLLFYFLLSCALLIKALVGVFVVLAGCGVFVLASCDWRGLRFLLNPLGGAIFLLLSGGWFAAAYVEYPGYLDTQIMHHFGRLTGEMGRDGTFFFYWQATLLMLLPWSPFILVGVLRGIWRKFWREPLWRFVACWFVMGFILFTVSPFQRKHYLAPLLPPLSLVAALSLLACVRVRMKNSDLVHLLHVVACVFMCAVGAGVVVIVRPRAWPTIAILIAIMCAALLCTCCFLYLQRPRSALASVFTLTFIVIVAATSFVLPAHDSYRDVAELGRRTNQICPPHAKVYLFGTYDSELIYYVNRTTVRIDDPVSLEAGLPRESNSVYVLTPADYTRYLELYGRVTVLERCASLRKHQPPEQRELLVELALENRAAARRE